MIVSCDEKEISTTFVLGHSEGMSRVWDNLRLVATSRCNPVLILGETGTGKEVAARIVHHWRGLDEQPFIAVNCASLSPALLESELFGHARGSFTDAHREKAGLFEQAGEGTIYLDEISEMPLELQAKLLRVLQDGRFRRVGGTVELVCRATVIASSNRPLAAESAAGRFRRDLYYRLAVFPVTIPPLRSPARRRDIPLLAEYFLKRSQIAGGHRVRGFSHPAMEKLVGHSWPGNVRELRNVVDRAILLEQDEYIGPDNIELDSAELEPARLEASSPLGAVHPVPSATEERGGNEFSLATAERMFIQRALRETNGHRAKAAMLLGITRATLHAKIKAYGLANGPQNELEADSDSLRLALPRTDGETFRRRQYFSKAG